MDTLGEEDWRPLMTRMRTASCRFPPWPETQSAGEAAPGEDRKGQKQGSVRQLKQLGSWAPRRDGPNSSTSSPGACRRVAGRGTGVWRVARERPPGDHGVHVLQVCTKEKAAPPRNQHSALAALRERGRALK